MKSIVVYYGTPAGVWISIDGMHLVDTYTASIELVKGKVQTAFLQKERYEPVGLFSPSGSLWEIEEPDGKKHPLLYGEANILPIDYETISEGDLKSRLSSRLANLSKDLKDPDVNIKCVRGVPPGGYQPAQGA
jgi:hypothetical protein